MQIKVIQKNILARYYQHGRSLPWRKTRDPYAIHVSEVMLQQTQVERVIPYFHQWMKDFPDYESLAKASKADLLKHWSGLGFNSRALRLQACAKKIMENGGLKPTLNSRKDALHASQRSQQKMKCGNVEGRKITRNELMKLPGIGPYTSAAIMAFAWNLEVPVIDTNIRRVLIFLFKLDEKISMSELETFATKIIPSGKSRDRHNALMDYGALELTARKTKIKPISKQSKFEGSDRQVRGRILKQLVRSPITNNQLQITIVQKEFPRKQVKDILAIMQKEGLIKIRKGVITIAE